MKIKHYLFLLFLISVTACNSKNTQQSKPNIVFILADDLGYGDLGCYGQKEIKTPNIDKLALEGMKFTDQYAGNTVCAPSRGSIITGLHTGHATIRGNTDVLLRNDEKTIAKELKNLGYSTACIGKWGVGHPPGVNDPKRNGFDYFFGYLSMWHAHNYYPEFLWKNGKKIKLNNVVERPKEHYKKGQAELTGYATVRKDYTPDLFTEDALKYIENQKSPFFLYLTYTIPHANDEAEWFNHHGMEVPDLGQYVNKNWPEVEKAKAAMITRLDGYVGRIKNKIKQLGLEKNTIIVFTSDNGPHSEGGVDPTFFKSSGIVRGQKRDLYDGGIRIPAIYVWKNKIKPNVVSNHVSAFWDVLPTLVEVAGGNPKNNLDGISFLPTLLGNSTQEQHEYLYWEFHEGGASKQAVRIGNYKVLRLSPSSPIEVYDLSKDIKELSNIAAAHPELVQKGKELFKSARNNSERWPLLDNKNN